MGKRSKRILLASLKFCPTDRMSRGRFPWDQVSDQFQRNRLKLFFLLTLGISSDPCNTSPVLSRMFLEEKTGKGQHYIPYSSTLRERLYATNNPKHYPAQIVCFEVLVIVEAWLKYGNTYLLLDGFMTFGIFRRPQVPFWGQFPKPCGSPL
jgi:hypothetical protein